MATKKSKANGKAREKTERPHFDVALVPFHGRLTPAGAKRWLAEDHAGFNLLATNGLRHAEEEADRIAFSWLAEGLEGMVSACAKAIQTEKPVGVSSDLGPGSGAEMAQASRLLRYPLICVEEIREYVGEDIPALGQIAAMVTRRLLEAEKANDFDPGNYFDEKEAEREADDPGKRINKLWELERETKAERDAAVEAATMDFANAIDKATDTVTNRVAAPFELRLKWIEYEERLIWSQFDDYDGDPPGKPPRGWKLATGSEALKRVRKTAGGTA